MGRGRAYKNVICLGHILDAEGKKMSKSLGNIVDPWIMIEKYGVDTLRLWMYSVNQPGESKNFDEKTVAELHNKVFNLLYNVLAFYELYRDVSLEKETRPESTNVLDVWILGKLDALTMLTTENIDAYKLLEPVRAMREFIDGLSTWYVRRSRERIKEGDGEAKTTLHYVLKTVAQLLAPFAPFAAEDIWQKLKHSNDTSSVHLSSWPVSHVYEAATIENMDMLREVVTMGLKARQTLALPVRQPLASITVTGARMDEAYTEILKDELNVRGVDFADGEAVAVVLDTNITPELKREGDYRELVRAVQDMRKKEGLTPSDPIALTLPESARETMVGFEDDLKKTVLATSVGFEGETILIKK
jgi:isoleucyl-tRNA synthetase